MQAFFLCHVVFVIHLNPKYSCYSHLHEDSEEDDGDDGSEEQVLDFIIVQQEPQWEGYGTSQATVGNNELVLFGQLHNTEFIDEGCKPDDSWNTEKKKNWLIHYQYDHQFPFIGSLHLTGYWISPLDFPHEEKSRGARFCFAQAAMPMAKKQ